MFAVEQFIDGAWYELWSYKTEQEAIDWIKAIHEENTILSRITDCDHSGEYRVRETSK